MLTAFVCNNIQYRNCTYVKTDSNFELPPGEVQKMKFCNPRNQKNLTSLEMTVNRGPPTYISDY